MARSTSVSLGLQDGKSFLNSLNEGVLDQWLQS